MAAKALFVALAIFLTANLSAVSVAKQFIVGDDNGWRTNFDYQNWAKDKDFQVGDALVFNYHKGDHNVIKVTGPEFQKCEAPSNAVTYNTGNDTIPLEKPGTKWYMCGVPTHCKEGNQRLAITVVEDWLAPAPAPAGGSDVPGQSSGSVAMVVGAYLPVLVAVATLFNSFV